jgi:hypothetical protein
VFLCSCFGATVSAYPCSPLSFPRQAVNFVRKKLITEKNVKVVSNLLVGKALELASNDNITAVVICFGALATES